jgi:hypothetical protein
LTLLEAYIGYGAKAAVTGNSYTGDDLTASDGIIVIGGPYYGGPVATDTKIVGNIVRGYNYKNDQFTFVIYTCLRQTSTEGWL